MRGGKSPRFRGIIEPAHMKSFAPSIGSRPEERGEVTHGRILFFHSCFHGRVSHFMSSCVNAATYKISGLYQLQLWFYRDFFFTNTSLWNAYPFAVTCGSPYVYKHDDYDSSIGRSMAISSETARKSATKATRSISLRCEHLDRQRVRGVIS